MHSVNPKSKIILVFPCFFQDNNF